MDETIRTLEGAVTSRNRNTDIILVLKVKEGKDPKTTTGLIDKRLFSGENNLHAKMNIETCLWHLEYDSGILPEPLKQQFTSFPRLMKFVIPYFDKRNVEISQVIDNASAA